MTASALGVLPETRQRTWLHRAAVSLAVAAFPLIIAGALVTSTGSGFASPEPVKLDRFVGTGLYEHGHRTLAWIVGALALTVVVLFGRWERRAWVRRLSIAALGAIVLQGALGILIVRLKLQSPLVSIMHAGVAELTLGLLVSLAVFSSPWWLDTPEAARTEDDRKRLRRAAITAAVVYVQILLGAWYRHTSSTTALIAHIVWVMVVAACVLVMKTHRALLTVFLLQLLAGPMAWIFTKGKVVKAIGEYPEPLSRALPITLHVALGALLFALSVIAILGALRREPEPVVMP
jgi:cytochrome c oxidase assembly protein subunit 15